VWFWGRALPGDDGPVDFLPAATREPGRLALTDGERSWSHGALAGAADRVASGVLGLDPVDPAGVPHRARDVNGARPIVATLLPPSPEAVVVTHAVLRSRALLAPLNPGLTGRELSSALAALRPGRLVVSPGTDELARSASVGEGVAEIVRIERLEAPARVAASLPSEAADRVDVVGEPGRLAGVAKPAPADEARTVPAGREIAVLWTSGTSGRPRGVVLRASALRHSAEASRARLGLGADDRWYASLSLAHVGGLALVARAGLLGSALVTRGGFDARVLNAAIDGGGVTHASLVPTMLARLLDGRGRERPADGFGLLLVGGARCPPALVERAFRARLPVALTYGMTEATSQVATAPPGMARRDAETVGRPLEGIAVRIGSDRDEGEILVRGPTLAARLWDGEALVDEEGWYHTGDLGRLDDEGRLFVTGRRSARIVTGGVTVDPLEVEGVLRALDGVLDAGVVGVPDLEWGEAVWAAVVPVAGKGNVGGDARPSALAPEPRLLGEDERVTDEGRLRAEARRRLAAPKVPKRVLEISSLPVNANGKVDRAALRELLVRR